MQHKPPLISSVMPTRARPELARAAMERWKQQTYPNKELIIVDDAFKSLYPQNLCLVTPTGTIQYYRVNAKRSIGWKLNFGIKQSRGLYIQKFDDDDLYREDFIEKMLRELILANAEIVYLESAFIYLQKARLTLHSGAGWRFGASLIFTRRVWDKRPFRDISYAEDNYFLDDHRGESIAVCDPSALIIVRHGVEHTWTKVQNMCVEEYFLRYGSKYLNGISANDIENRLCRSTCGLQADYIEH